MSTSARATIPPGRSRSSASESFRPLIRLISVRLQNLSGSFNYLTVDEEGESSEWLPDWEDPSVTPLMVQVDLTMNRDSRLTWPMLEVAPLIDSTAVRRARSLAPI